MARKKKGKSSKKDTEKETPGKRALKLFGPFMTAGIVIGLMYLVLDRTTFIRLVLLMGAYMVPPAGKETIIPAAVLALDIDFVLISLSIAFVDIVTALFLVWNFDLARKVPLLGPWMSKFEKSNANVMKEKKWLKGLAYGSLIMFVIVPFQGSGGIGASVMGRIVGMRPWTVFSAITIGAITGCLLIGYIAKTIGTKLFSVLQTTQAKVIGSIIALIVVISIFYFLRRSKKKKDRIGEVNSGDEEE
jgi:hypothetical protein